MIKQRETKKIETKNQRKQKQRRYKQKNGNKKDRDKVDRNNIETKKTETKKTETKKIKAKRTETKKTETKKTETKKTETKKTEIKKTETKKIETKQTETKKTEISKTETKKTETKKTETKKTENKENRNKEDRNKERRQSQRVSSLAQTRTMSRIFRPRCFIRLVFFLGIFVLTYLLILSSFEFFQGNYNPVVDRVCAIPELDAWDKSVLKYMETSSSKIECPKVYNILSVNDTGFIVYNKTALKQYSLSEQLLTCKYQIVKRTLGDKEVKLEPEAIFNPPVFINGNIFRVSCKHNKRLVYDFLHLNPYWVEDETRENEIGLEDDDHYSVLLIGIDSVSRSHALRNLQKSYKYLNETLGAYDLKGFMKVGSNTFPNLIPLLTGMRHGKFPMVNNKVSYCDSMPLLWNSKEMKHYATLYSEDRVDISTFNCLKPGFYHSPTDFYYRPYNMAMDLFTPVIMKPMDTEGKVCPWACPCYANKDNFTTQVDHFKGYLNRFKTKLKFAFFWANAAHESFELLRQTDNSLLE